MTTTELALFATSAVDQALHCPDCARRAPHDITLVIDGDAVRRLDVECVECGQLVTLGTRA